MRADVKSAFLCNCSDGKIGVRKHLFGVVNPHRLYIFRRGAIAQGMELAQKRRARHIGKPAEIVLGDFTIIIIVDIGQNLCDLSDIDGGVFGCAVLV